MRSGGAIVNFSSSVTRLSQPNYSAYAGTKAAMEALTPILAKELAGKDITVNTVAPGPVATPLFLEGKPQEAIDHMAEMSPMKRLGEPEDIAEVVAYLAGRLAGSTVRSFTPTAASPNRLLASDAVVRRGATTPKGALTMRKTIAVTGASSGFGAMTVRELANAGHTVYAGMRDVDGHNSDAAEEVHQYAAEHDVDLRAIELDVSSQDSVDEAVALIIDEQGQLDVIVHNAGHMVVGPAEAFTVDQLIEMYDVNVLSTQRLNRAALPHMRERGDGLLVWVGSTSTRGGTPPYLGPYFAAKAAEDSLAVSYAVELARFGVDTVIIVPGSFTTGTNHFAHAGHPDDKDVAAAYDTRYSGLMDDVSHKLADLAPDDADPQEVAVQIARVVDLPKGKRPFRVHIDPSDDGAETVNAVGDHIRKLFYQRIGLGDLLQPANQG